MVNNSKIKLMTKLAVFEKNHPQDMKLGKYFKTDFIRLNLIKTVIYVTVGYALCLFLVAFYNIELLIREAVRLDYGVLGLKILGVYIILLLISIMINLIASNQQFKFSRKRLNRYYKRLKQLQKFYAARENEK